MYEQLTAAQTTNQHVENKRYHERLKRYRKALINLSLGHNLPEIIAGGGTNNFVTNNVGEKRFWMEGYSDIFTFGFLNHEVDTFELRLELSNEFVHDVIKFCDIRHKNGSKPFLSDKNGYLFDLSGHFVPEYYWPYVLQTFIEFVLSCHNVRYTMLKTFARIAGYKRPSLWRRVFDSSITDLYPTFEKNLQKRGMTYYCQPPVPIDIMIDKHEADLNGNDRTLPYTYDLSHKTYVVLSIRRHVNQSIDEDNPWD